MTATSWMPQTAPAGPAPYDYLVIDIETGNASDAEVKAHFDVFYEPPSNYKDPAKITAHREEAWVKAQKKSALLPSAPVIAIGLKSATELRCLHSMREHTPAIRQIGSLGAMVEGFADVQGMLSALSCLLAARTAEETAIVGFNIRDFDLPRLRRAMARLRMPIPGALLNPDQPLFDNMHKYLRLFSGEREIMIAAERVSEELGIDPHRLQGKIVPELHAAGEIESVIDKCLLDVCEEEQQFLRMTGRA